MLCYLIPHSLLILVPIRIPFEPSLPLQDLVESNLVKAADQQKSHYDKQPKEPSFAVNDKVWLSVPTAGKLQPRWEGGWKVTSVKSLVTIEINDGRKNQVVHSNRLRHRFQAAADSSESKVTHTVVPLWSQLSTPLSFTTPTTPTVL